ncbi:membrane protein [Paraphoma chrysanthemicola]|uniref:Membrane protein n=1 Tax=Paraphoma chrysanthemicola TaxID=798071 RepID=A0A8K0VVA8_9PLEO|nr:membrane protein [Paraphoma chrysanthemicola]
MASISRALNNFFDRLGKSRLLSDKVVLYSCATCGIWGSFLFLFGLVAAGSVPAPKPWWDAERMVQHWRDNLRGGHVGAAFLTLSGLFYVPFSAAIWWNIKRVPGIHPIIPMIQIAAGAAGVWTLSGPGDVLAAVLFRLERPPEITLALTELFWILTFAPWGTFLVQDWAWAYAIMKDPREKPPIPKAFALINIITPLCFSPATLNHITKHGPLAWDGALSFWLSGMSFVVQMCVDSSLLVYATYHEPAESTERITEKAKENVS